MFGNRGLCGTHPRMCFYDPPPLLMFPDLTAALICSLPLAASATSWREFLPPWVGLSIASLGAHFFIIAMVHDSPPSTEYWLSKQTEVVPVFLTTVAYFFVTLFATSQTVRSLSRGEYPRAFRWLALILLLIGAVAGLIAYALRAGPPVNKQQAQLLALNAGPSEADVPAVNIYPADCIFPPFGDGMTGYIMLAALVLFEMLVAVAIANGINRRLAATARAS